MTRLEQLKFRAADTKKRRWRIPMDLKEIDINLPWDIGGIKLEVNETQQRAAWALYVELTTRIATQALSDDGGYYAKR